MAGQQPPTKVEDLTEDFILKNVRSEAVLLLKNLIEIEMINSSSETAKNLRGQKKITPASFEFGIHQIAKEYFGEQYYERAIERVRRDLEFRKYLENDPPTPQ